MRVESIINGRAQLFKTVWMGGPLWDAIQTDGLVMSVMNSGEVGYFRLAELEEEG